MFMSRLLSDWHCGTAIAAEHVFHIDEVRRQEPMCVKPFKWKMLCCYALAKIQVHTLARWRATRLFTNLFGVLALVNFGHRSCFFTTNLVICEVQQMISCSDTADGCGGGNPVDGYSPLGWNGYIPRNDRMTRELGITWHQVASLISPLLWLESLVELSARSMPNPWQMWENHHSFLQGTFITLHCPFLQCLGRTQGISIEYTGIDAHLVTGPCGRIRQFPTAEHTSWRTRSASCRSHIGLMKDCEHLWFSRVSSNTTGYCFWRIISK